MSTTSRQILAAVFPTPDGAAHAAAAVVAVHPGAVRNTAVVVVGAEGSVEHLESKDWGPKRGALVGGVVGLLAGPLGLLAGSGLGAIAAKLRDSGFPDAELEQLGTTLSHGDSVVVFEIAASAADSARLLVEALRARAVVDAALDASVATLFDPAMAAPATTTSL